MWAFSVLLTYLQLSSYALTGQPSPVGKVRPKWGTWSRLSACGTECPGCGKPETSRDHIVSVGPQNPATQQQVTRFWAIIKHNMKSFYKVQKTLRIKNNILRLWLLPAFLTLDMASLMPHSLTLSAQRHFLNHPIHQISVLCGEHKQELAIPTQYTA